MSENTNKVIIIDDEENIRNLCQRALKKIDIPCDSAGSAELGLKLIDEKSYKVILLDIMLPQMSGLELLEIIRTKYPETEVIMLTGNATIKDSVAAMKKGAYDFITKPFEIHEVRKSVQKALEKGNLIKKLWQLEEILSIFEISKAMGRLMPIKQLLELICEKVKIAVKADEASIALLSANGHKLEYQYVLGKINKVGDTEDMATGILGEVSRTKEPILIEHLSQEARFKDSLQYEKAETVISVPMLVKDELIGTLNLLRKKDNKIFSEYDLRIVTIFAQQAALGIQNARDYEDLKQLDDMKNDFVANVSHELKTPLQTMTNACELMLKKDSENKMLTILLRNVMRMKKLVTELLDITLLEKGSYKIKYEILDTDKLLKELLEDLESQAKAKNMDFSIECGKLHSVEGDKDAIKRVFINLITNAFKYCPAGTQISVGAMEKDAEIVFHVKDNGPGISDQVKARVFDRFFQNEAGKSFTDKPAGLGLGLSIAMDIINKHGGKIWLESELKVGTTFYFSIPYKKSETND